MILHGFSVPLAASATEVVVDKSPETVRYATLMHNGEEKLKIFNQRSYKFIAPQGEFFTVQGNVICGRINEEFSLNIQDYVCLDIHDKINKFIQFKQPASGLILGPDGVTMFFTMARGVAVVANNFEPETDVFEYIPSVKKFDSRTNFVYDETMTAQEFVASGKRTGLIVNTGSSLFGWNVRFDNEKYLSLKDTLTYQAKNNALPSPNGELVHEDKVFKFFGVEKIQVRQKVVYYSYGRV